MAESGEITSLKIEAEEVSKEVAFAVKTVSLSETLQSTVDIAYLNLTTKEDIVMCVELSVRGFRVVGNEYDRTDQADETLVRYYETIYALLDSTSPGYRQTFGDVLMDKLSQLQQERSDAK